MPERASTDRPRDEVTLRSLEPADRGALQTIVGASCVARRSAFGAHSWSQRCRHCRQRQPRGSSKKRDRTGSGSLSSCLSNTGSIRADSELRRGAQPRGRSAQTSPAVCADARGCPRCGKNSRVRSNRLTPLSPCSVMLEERISFSAGCDSIRLGWLQPLLHSTPFLHDRVTTTPSALPLYFVHRVHGRLVVWRRPGQ